MQPAKLQQILQEGIDLQRQGRTAEAQERYARLRTAAGLGALRTWRRGTGADLANAVLVAM